MAVTILPTPAEAIVEGILKPKMVKKSILKADKSNNCLKTVQNSLKTPTILDNCLSIDIVESIIPKMSSTMPQNADATVKNTKTRSKKGLNSSIVEQPLPITVNNGHILETNAPINGTTEAIVQKVVQNSLTTPFLDVEMIISDDISKKEDVLEVEKRGRGRPAGSLDKVSRHRKGELLKPPVQHGKLGRPLGSKDKAPRRKVLQNSTNSS